MPSRSYIVAHRSPGRQTRPLTGYAPRRSDWPSTSPGRTPKMNRTAGREHWPDCYTAILAGGGVCGGAAYGSSDRIGAYPTANPVTPGDLAATIFWRFGIDPAMAVHDTTGRPYALADGEPLRDLFSSL